MKRAQFTPGIIMTIVAWLMLAIVVLLLMIFKANGHAADTQITAVETASNEAVLTAYLRSPVTLGGDTVPLAEALAYDIMKGKNDLTKAPTEKFLALLPTTKLQRINIALPDKTEWKYGRDFFTGTGIQTTLPTPDGRFFTVTYTQTDFDTETDATTGVPG